MRRTNSHIKPALKGDSSRARPVGDAARGESGGIGSIASGSEARRPYSNQRCGCEQSEQTEGLNRGCACLRQPFSQSAFTAYCQLPAWGAFWCALQPHPFTRLWRISHGEAIFHCASAQFHPAQAGFHCGRKSALPHPHHLRADIFYKSAVVFCYQHGGAVLLYQLLKLYAA